MVQTQLIIHGGVGRISEVYKEEYDASIKQVLKAGSTLLERGYSALDTVEACVALLEDNPLFNAGCGAVLNHEGGVELDASIMDGALLNVGAIAGVCGIKNPIHLARAVLEKSEHVLLIGRGAEAFAEEQAIAIAPMEYFITKPRKKQLDEAIAQHTMTLDHNDQASQETKEKKFGTVGAVARDRNGNLASATSTGGMTNKRFGRVGDSPIVGAGVWADNDTCAVSATGVGEHILRTVLAHRIASLIAHHNLNAKEASEQAIAFIKKRIQGIAGVIVIDRNGMCATAYSTPEIIGGMVADGEQTIF